MQVLTMLAMTVTPPLALTMVTTLTHMAPCVLVSLEWPRAIATVVWVWPTIQILEASGVQKTFVRLS